MTRGLEVLPGMLPVLESAAQCVQQGWLTLLVGGPGSGMFPYTACTACNVAWCGKSDPVCNVANIHQVQEGGSRGNIHHVQERGSRGNMHQV